MTPTPGPKGPKPLPAAAISALAAAGATPGATLAAAAAAGRCMGEHTTRMDNPSGGVHAATVAGYTGPGYTVGLGKQSAVGLYKLNPVYP